MIERIDRSRSPESAPVALYSARHERNSIRFNMINPKTGNRIKMVTQDAETGEPLSRGDTVKGYEFSKNRYDRHRRGHGGGEGRELGHDDD